MHIHGVKKTKKLIKVFNVPILGRSIEGNVPIKVLNIVLVLADTAKLCLLATRLVPILYYNVPAKISAISAYTG